MVRTGYKQTEVGIIPENWELRPLLDLLKLPTGQVDPRMEPYRSMVLVAPDHIQSRTGQLLEQRAAFEQNAISGKFLFQPGDIVYSKIRPYLRKAILASFHGLCSADMYPLTPTQDVSPKFMLAVLLGPHFSAFAESISMRSGIPKINRDELSEYTVALPPLEEQRAIAEVLGEVDGLLVALERLIAKKRDVKTAVMQQLLTGERRLDGFGSGQSYKETEVGRIPLDWQVANWGEAMAECFSGATPYRGRPEYYKGNIPWISSSELNYNYITGTKEKITQEAVERTNLRIVPKNTFLMAITGLEAAGTRGSCAITGIEATTNQSCMAVIPNSKLLTGYLYHYYVHFGEELALRYCQGTKQQSYTAGLVKLLPIILPSPEEQRAIAAVISDMDAEIAALEARHAKTQAIKQGMMQELLTGRVRLTLI